MKLAEGSIVKASVKIALGAGVGFMLSWMISHPKSKLRKKLPQRKIKNVSIFPNVKVYRKDKEYHLHHWINYSSFYIIYYFRQRRFMRSKLLNGFILGIILQGLTYKDRFCIVNKLIDNKNFNG